jgi:23S rRNA (adenine2503-C2)-methyltransferase
LENSQNSIFDLSYGQIKEWLISHNEGTYQADQIVKWIYRKMVTDLDHMIDLKPGLKDKLRNFKVFDTLNLLDENYSNDGLTYKVLLQTSDGQTIETSLMNFSKKGISRERRTVCISTQIGCNIGCKFCATGQQGFNRNLSTGEIVEQVLFFMRQLRDKNITQNKTNYWPYITHVVFMGMGEPLANYDHVRNAIEIFNSPKGLNLGVRQITLSTSGLVPRILQLVNENLQFELAISLHAATDELRNVLVPINQKYPLKEIISACREYQLKKRRFPFIEYALFKGINDTLKDADNLIRLLDNFKCSVNLILGNETPSKEFMPSSMDRALEFQNRLMSAGLRTMIRASKGSDIEAGCGQLRSRRLSKIL